MHAKILGCGLALCLTLGASALELDLASECGLLAASPFDPATPAGQGVLLENIDPEPAIAACEAALAELPGDALMAFQLGRAHDAAGNFDKAIAQYEAAIRAGHKGAMVALGGLYELGLGVEANTAEAIRLYQQAFDDSGLPIAAANLGYIYDEGVGVTADKAKAAEFYAVASDGGVTWATVSLGFLYEMGHGVEQDLHKAVSLYQMAAAQGDVDAINNLGAAYEAGFGGLEQSIKAALGHYERAADGGSGMAAANLGDIYAYGREGIKPDAKRAEAYYRTAIDTGPARVTARAQNSLAYHLALSNASLDEAEALATEALAYDQTDGSTLDTLGWIKHLQGNNSAAYVYLTAAVNNKPATTQYAHLGDVQRALGDIAAARQSYEAALALLPNDYSEPSVDTDAITRWLAKN